MGILLFALALYLAWALLLFAAQRNMLFPHALIPTPQETPGLPAGARVFWLTVPQGRVEAWFLPPAGSDPAPALLFAHGNAELIDDCVTEMASFARRGVGVMLVEYPGYGRSRGSPSFATVRAAALAAYDELVAQPEVDPELVVAYGRSLGSGAAAILSHERRLAAMILQSAFTTPRAFARRYLLPGFLVRDRFEVLEAVRTFRNPVLIVHGRRDEVIPFAHGEALAREAADATFVVHDCAHNDCPPQWDEHVRLVLAFLQEKQIAR